MLKLEKLVFYLFIFLLPFQTRKIIYQWGGSFNEWTSVYLYLTDILVLSLFFFWFIRKRKDRFLKEPLKLINLKEPGFWLAVFLIFSLFSLIQSANMKLGFYSWIKLLELTVLFFYLKHNFKKLFNFKKLSYIFIASGLFQSLIAIGQYFQQKSLELKFLAESPLSPEIAGVAKIIIEGVKAIRVYGTLPHPNILAVFLFFLIFLLYFLWLKENYSFKRYLFLSVSLFLFCFALFLTYSRLIIFTLIISSIIYFLLSFRKNKKKIVFLFLILLFSFSLISFFAWPEILSRFNISSQEQSVGLRLFYAQISFLIIQEYPLTGIGLGNFVWEIRMMLNLFYSWLHQPVHNIYLLIASETGLIGLFFFFMFLYQLLRRFIKRKEFLLIALLFSFLFIGLFDHFFWTLQQGQLIFWILLSFASIKNFSTV